MEKQNGEINKVTATEPAEPCVSDIHGYPHKGMPLVLKLAASIHTPSEWFNKDGEQTSLVDAKYKFTVAQNLISLYNKQYGKDSE